MYSFVNGIRRKNNGKIKNFDCNNVMIPNLGNFIVKSAICYIENQENNGSCGGHYIIWQRNKIGNEWIRISDTSGRTYKNLISNLTNVTLLLLERL